MRTPDSHRAMDAAREILHRLRENAEAHIVELVEAVFYGSSSEESSLACKLLRVWPSFDHDDAAPFIRPQLAPGSPEESLARSFPHNEDDPLPKGVRCPHPLTVRLSLGAPRSPVESRCEELAEVAATFKRKKSREERYFYKVEVEPDRDRAVMPFRRWLDATTSRLDEIEAVFGSVKPRLPQSVRVKLSPTCVAIFDILAAADGPMIGDEIASKLRKRGIKSGATAKSLSQRGIPDLNSVIRSEGFRVENERGKGYYIEKIRRGVGAEKSGRR